MYLTSWTQDLLGGVGRGRDDVRGQHGQRRGLAEALRRLALGGDRRAEDGVLEPVAERSRAGRASSGRGQRLGGDRRPGAGPRARATTGAVAARAPGGTASPVAWAPEPRSRLQVSTSRELSRRSAMPCCMVRCTSSSSVAGGSGRGSPSGLVEQGHTVSIIDKVPRAFRRLPGRLARDLDRGLGLRPRRPRPGRGQAGGRPGRGHERGQLEHPDGPDRPGELRHPQRRGPDLRPPPGRDLPAPRASPPWPP